MEQAKRSGKTDAAKAYSEQIKRMDSDMDSLFSEARDYVSEAERAGEIREALGRPEARALNKATMVADSVRNEADQGDEWRGLLPSGEEFRAAAEGTAAEGGYTVPAGTASKYVGLLRANTVFLKGIPAENLLPFDSMKWTLPVLSSSDMPTLVAENAAITAGDDSWDGLEFDSKKYADIRNASNEILEDSALNLRNVLGQNMIRNVAQQFDDDAFNGDGSTTPILGIVSQGTSNPASGATGTTATFDDIADAIGRLWGANANPTVIWAAPDAAIALSKERDNGSAYVADAGSAVGLARRLPMLISTNIPAGNVLVGDGTRIFAGVRKRAAVAYSPHSRFEYDQGQFRVTMRCAGLYVTESNSLQVITAAP